MKRRGFTLLELMVVVAIIVILVAILIPVLSGAKTRAYAATTTALLGHLQTNIDSYHVTFGAYPGPASAALTAGKTTKVLSGAQNLLLGLSYAMTSGNPLTGLAHGPNSVPIPGSSMRVDPTQPSGPANYASTNAFTGKPEQLSPFYDAPNKQLSKALSTNTNAWPPTGVAGGNTTYSSFAFPVIVDTFPDGLPILYFRRTPGAEARTSGQGPTSVGDAFEQPPYYPYYWNENSEYTDTNTLKATSGAEFRQKNLPLPTAGLGLMSGAGSALKVMNSMVQSNSQGARGGYLLMSAGPDRLYGGKANDTVANDDIFVVGGN